MDTSEGDAGSTDDLVLFGDDFGDLSYAAFGGSTGAPVVDEFEAFAGSASMRIDMPGDGYTGGALVPDAPLDVSGFNAVTFWAKTNNTAANFDKVGIGNDSDSNIFQVERLNLQFTDDWQFYVMPLGAPSDLTELSGLFHWADGGDGAYSVWIDDLRYTTLDNLDAPSPAIATITQAIEVGRTTPVVGQVVNVWYRGEDPESADDDVLIGLQAQPIFWSYASSNEDIATVSEEGIITGAGEGTATITAFFGGVEAAGAITVEVGAGVVLPSPDGPAPTPDTPVSALVEVMFSDAPGYEATFVETFRTVWSASTILTEVVLGDGDNVLRYDEMDFVGINFEGDNSIDLTDATNVRFDLWTPNGTRFEFKIVDFGPNNGFLGEPNDDSEGFVILGEGGSRDLPQGEWVSYDIPFTEFQQVGGEGPGLVNQANVSQLVLTGRAIGDAPAVATFYLDNIYFYQPVEL